MTASEIFNVPLNQMTPDVRRKAKAINFGVIYGISAFGLANNLRIKREEAKNFIDTYFIRYPGIKEYMDRTVQAAKSDDMSLPYLVEKYIHPKLTKRSFWWFRLESGNQCTDPRNSCRYNQTSNDKDNKFFGKICS